jgi:hypothetical protein
VEPKPQRSWLDLERFRSARAFGSSGCLLPGVLLLIVALAYLL